MRQKVAKSEAIAVVAGRQHGVISTRQLIAVGLSPSGISRQVRDGRLRRLYQGVYAVGHTAPSPTRTWMAAILACRRVGPDGDPLGRKRILEHWGAALSHLSAAYLWKLLPLRDGPVDVSIHGGGGKAARQGLRVHRRSTLLHPDVTLRSGIPVTTPTRTITDLRRVVSKPGKDGLISPRELRRAIRQAEVLGLPLGDEIEGDRTRSDLERDFLRLCRRHRLPDPQVNVRVGPHLVDFLWPDSAVIVETDGYRYHGGRTAFTEDRDRDLTLRSMGFEVIRISDEQVNGQPGRVADLLRRVLASRSR